jgi:hypothetical protein
MVSSPSNCFTNNFIRAPRDLRIPGLFVFGARVRCGWEQQVPFRNDRQKGKGKGKDNSKGRGKGKGNSQSKGKGNSRFPAGMTDRKARAKATATAGSLQE